MGTFETAFTVPDLDAQKTTVRLSSVVWSNQKEALTSSIGTAWNQQEIARSPPAGG